MKLFATAVIALLLLTGCSTTPTDLTSQSTPSNTHALVEDSSKSYTEKVTSTVGGYYDETVSFLSDECGVAGYSKAAGIATVNGIGESVWSAAKTTVNYGLGAHSTEGIILSAVIGSGIGFMDGVKKAYNDFKWETSSCS